MPAARICGTNLLPVAAVDDGDLVAGVVQVHRHLAADGSQADDDDVVLHAGDALTAQRLGQPAGDTSALVSSAVVRATRVAPRMMRITAQTRSQVGWSRK